MSDKFTQGVPGPSRRSMMLMTAMTGLAGAASLGAPSRARAAESLRARFHMTPPRGRSTR